MSESEPNTTDVHPHNSVAERDRLRIFMERFATEELLPLEQGVLFNEVLKMQNPITGRRYTLREAAALFGVNLGLFRGYAALCRPHIVPKDMEAERAKLHSIMDRSTNLSLAWEFRPPAMKPKRNRTNRPSCG